MSDSQALVVAEPPVATPAIQLGTLRATSGAGLLEAASTLATPLKELIDKRGLSKPLGRGSNKEYVMVEGWTAMGAMLGITPHEVTVVEKDGAFTATVELRRLSDQSVVGRASAECGAKDDPVWANRPRNARRSMALTRATGKAFRMAFSWIIVMAGYEATPAEEMPENDVIDVPAVKAQPLPMPPPVPPVPRPVASESADQILYAREVKSGKTANGNAYWEVTFDRPVTAEGYKTVKTWDAEVGQLATEAAAQGWPLGATFSRKGKFTNLDALEVVPV